MPITRTTWTDDDGSGTTGTIINNAEKVTLYDQIDAKSGFTTVLFNSDTGTKNAWAPGILGDTWMQWSGAGAITVNGISDTGLKAGVALVIRSTAAQVMTFTHDSGSAATGEKIFTDGLPITIGDSGWIRLVRSVDEGTGYWVVTGWDQGTAIAWTPTLTFTTPGDLTVVYGTRAGAYIRDGRHITIHFHIVTTTWTHSTAAGALNITGLPYTCNPFNAMGGLWISGHTMTNYTCFSARVQAGTTVADVVATAQGQAASTLAPANLPSGTQQTLIGTVTYFI